MLKGTLPVSLKAGFGRGLGSVGDAGGGLGGGGDGCGSGAAVTGARARCWR